MILIRCWRCGAGPFNSSIHGEGLCEVTRIPTSDWIQFETPPNQFGRALWNLLAPLHGELPFGGPGDWRAIDLADTDAVTGLLPFANVPIKTTNSLSAQLLDVQPTQGEAERPEGISEEGEGGVG